MTTRSHPTVPCDAFVPLATVEGGPRPGQVEGRPCLRRRPLTSTDWLIPSFERPVRVGAGWVRTLHRDGRVLGVATGRGEQLPRREPILRPRSERTLGRIRSGFAYVDGTGSLLSSSIPITDRSSFEAATRTVIERNGPVLESGVWMQPLRLTGDGREDLLIAFTPATALAVPRFARLTTTQAEVCELAAGGCSTREIAERRSSSPETIRSHLKAAYRRLDISSRPELVPVIRELRVWRDELVPTLVCSLTR